MPKTLEELAMMLAKRDGISYEEEMQAIKECAAELEYAFQDGNIDEAEEILRMSLGIEPNYLDIFIF